MILLLPTKSRIVLISINLSLALALTTMATFGVTFGQPTGTTTKLVHAGQGNSSSVIIAFVPQKIEIKAGESVMWDSPTTVAEPHSVTFLKDKKYFADFASPFYVANSTEFRSVNPESNTEPTFPPSHPGETSKIVVAINARAILPIVLDANNVTYLEPNSKYTMKGTEDYVNSGWLWPEGQAPPGGPPISKFTVTFEKPGTYPYLCNVHPWMTGSVVVK